MFIKDERFYEISSQFYPRVTWILDEGYPKGYGFQQWLGTKGTDEAERIKNEAGEAGSRIHDGIEQLLRGQTLSCQGYSAVEWKKLCTFDTWLRDFQPDRIYAIERTLHSKDHRYAGTTDCILLKDDEVYVVDWKSSKAIHNQYWLQVAAYAHAIEEMKLLSEWGADAKLVTRTAILRLGSKSKKGYEFIVHDADEIKEDFTDFLGCLRIFLREHDGYPKPTHSELPDTISVVDYFLEKDQAEAAPETTQEETK
jgi:hypothetical protein